MMAKQPTFSSLINRIQAAHLELATQAGRAVNISLTLRNWLIGFYIAEYELNGSDRAEYGKQLLDRLAVELQSSLDRCYTGRYLRLCRQFRTTYPQIRKSLISESIPLPIGKSVISTLPFEADQSTENSHTTTPVHELITKLSFTHILELMKCPDATQRTFYELECMRGNWSVRELKRQIGSLYYERSGLSLNKRKLSGLAHQCAETQTALNLRNPYIFEFLGLKPAEVMSESHLEEQLTGKLQAFLLELGHGFCFEARQKRILIDDEHFFVDLVFYHRILKCHVLVELKLEKFSYENLGQLNTYVSWYAKNMTTEGDNPPVGILLCTDKNHALAEYALAGMDNQLFISKYQLELPKKEEMQAFIDNQLKAEMN